MIEDAGARQALRQLLKEYHKELVADRGMDVEAQVLEIIRELRDAEDFGAGLTIKEIAARFIERHSEDYEKKITPHWIGQIIRRKLQLKTERHREGYVISALEGAKLARLFEKYGILSSPVNLVNSEKEPEQELNHDEPLLF